jgi:hypothetical protein
MDLKYRTRVTTSIKNELAEAIRRLSEETRIPQSKLFDEALEDLFVKYGFDGEKLRFADE